ncbi:chemotaxis protein CheW, partial [Cyanobium sp. BA20m-p-22]|uniref:chemotaxis protein CheW n=1 Tax=Cyanobium sp. BA20m-p-22 TaxID=2823704 RepID=UPI0020CEDD63
RACIIVVHHHTAASPDQLVGLQVDLVDEVVFIEQSAIEPVPDFCDTVDGKFIQAMAKYKDSVLAILSVAELLKDAGNLQTTTALAPEQDQ